jgi:hypothetical protein
VTASAIAPGTARLGGSTSISSTNASARPTAPFSAALPTGPRDGLHRDRWMGSPGQRSLKTTLGRPALRKSKSAALTRVPRTSPFANRFPPEGPGVGMAVHPAHRVLRVTQDPRSHIDGSVVMPSASLHGTINGSGWIGTASHAREAWEMRNTRSAVGRLLR